MAEYLIMTKGGSFYYLVGHKDHVEISSFGTYSHLEISNRKIICASASASPLSQGLDATRFKEDDIKNLVGKQILFGGDSVGRTSSVVGVFLKIS